MSRLPYVPAYQPQGGLWMLCVIVLALSAGGYVLAHLLPIAGG